MKSRNNQWTQKNLQTSMQFSALEMPTNRRKEKSVWVVLFIQVCKYGVLHCQVGVRMCDNR